MAKLQRKSISKRTVEALSVEKDMVFWDSELPGFGVRVYPSGNKVYVVQTRAQGRSRRVTVGRHGVITAEQARQRAALIIARVKRVRTRRLSPRRRSRLLDRPWLNWRRGIWRNMSQCAASRARRTSVV